MLARLKVGGTFANGKPCRVRHSDAVIWKGDDVARPVASLQQLHDMGLFVLSWVISYFIFRIVDGEKVFRREKLTINFGYPRARSASVENVYGMIIRRAVPRLRRPNRHWIRPTLVVGVACQSGNRHSGPHRPTVDVFLVVLRFCAGEDYLKAQTPRGHRRNGNSHGVQKLAMVLLVIMRVFPTHPTFEVGYVALQIRHCY